MNSVAIVVIIGLATTVAAQPQTWFVRDLGNLGSSTVAFCASPTGLAAGEFSDHAVVWTQNGTPHDAGTLGGDEAIFYGINDSGVAAGYYSVAADGRSHAVTWSENAGVRQLPDL